MSSETSRLLNTFVPPRPRPWLIKSLIPVNRWLNLYGIPGLRDLPGLRELPGIRGLCDIRQIHIPAADHQRLQHSLSGQAAVFVTPNHPEFFCDWMLDKEIAARYAPLTANWATHDVVNGMGRWGQRFWLANNLIAQIPGATDAAVAHSVQLASTGTPVLLHPEGGVHWHADHIHPLFPGAAKMALHTAAAGNRPVLIQPVIWKLTFLRDESEALECSMAAAEQQLRLASGAGLALPQRLARLYHAVLDHRCRQLGLAAPAGDDYLARQQQLLQQLLDALAGFGRFDGTPAQQATQLQAAIRQTEKQGQVLDLATRRRRNELARILRDPLPHYPAHWQQEQLAECLQRLRCEYLAWGSWRNRLHKLLPQPVGGRCAHIRAPAAIDIRAVLAEAPATDADTLTGMLQQRMQHTLDGLNAEIEHQRSVPQYANPFTAASKD